MSIIDRIFFSNKEHTQAIEYVVVGLGNPGNEYVNTRHNVGFMTMDKMSDKLKENFSINKFDSTYFKAVLSNKKVIFVKPQTYMNRSGEAVRQITSFYKIPLSNVIVVFDDISLEIGKIRIKRSGSHGGHNGIKSIINCCGSEKFPRIKIGVGNKPNDNWDLADWVLSKFSSDEISKINNSIDNVINSLELILNSGIDNAMNKFN